MKPAGTHEPRLSHEQVILYLPATGTDGTGAGIGPAWTAGAGATVSHPTPAAGFSTEFRCTRFTSPAAADKHLGVYFANADHCCAYRGNALSRGGFYFRALFKVNAIPNNSIRFFCGLSAQVGTGLATSNTPPANSVGLWCDTTDSAVLKLMTCDNSGTSTKTTMTNPETLTAGRLYEFILICIPNQSVVVTQLNNYADSTDGAFGTVLNSQNVSLTMPSNTVMMAPQVGLGNAANAGGGDCSFDIMSIYLRPNLKLSPTGTP